jgi:hypothetical protein
MAKDTEACGRCSMTVVVDAVDEADRDPFGDERIEVDQASMERVSPEAWLSRLSMRVEDAVTQFIWHR